VFSISCRNISAIVLEIGNLMEILFPVDIDCFQIKNNLLKNGF
jgi:hypothetical protein